MKQDEMVDELSTVFDSYANNLASKIKNIEDLWEKLQRQWDLTTHIEFERAVHSIKGSSAL